MSPPSTKPRLIIHGGAGNITRENLPPDAYAKYEKTLRSIHRSTSSLLEKGVTALDAATHAVTLFEDCPLFNCGKGAVSLISNEAWISAAMLTVIVGLYEGWDYRAGGFGELSYTCALILQYFYKMSSLRFPIQKGLGRSHSTSLPFSIE